MSVKAMAYVWDTPYKGAKKLMLLAIADRCDDEGTSCYPGVSKLAAKCGIKIRAAQALITELEICGEIAVQIQSGIDAGHGKTNQYYMKRYREDLRLKTPTFGTRIQQITPKNQGVQNSASQNDGVQNSASQAMQDPASQGMQNSAYNTSGYPSVDTSVKEITTTPPAATRQTHVSPSSNGDWEDVAQEADDPAMFVPKGENENSAHEGKVKTPQRKTTPPRPSPSPLPAADIKSAQTFSAGMKDDVPADKVNLAVALGEAWGIEPVRGDFSLYGKKAKKLIENGVPVERFKIYCDRQKEKAGTFASHLTIASITEGGRISEFLQWYTAQEEKDRKQKEAEERLYQQYPELRPRDPSVPVEYAPRDEVQRLMDMVLNPPNRQENVS